MTAWAIRLQPSVLVFQSFQPTSPGQFQTNSVVFARLNEVA
jgi:hypothetical protein